MVVEENKDIVSMRIDDLVGPFQTYVATLPQPRKKILALKVSKGKGKKEVVNSSKDDLSDDEVALTLAWKFRRFLKIYKGSKNPKVGGAKVDFQGEI
jgi:hypothetical protein